MLILGFKPIESVLDWNVCLHSVNGVELRSNKTKSRGMKVPQRLDKKIQTQSFTQFYVEILDLENSIILEF